MPVFHIVGIFEIHLDAVIALDPLADIGTQHRQFRIGAGMQRHHMQRIDHVLDALQPIAVDIAALDDLVAIGLEQQIVAREFRHRLRPNIGEDETGDFAHGISALADLVLEVAERRLARLIEALAVGGIEPAVIAAAQPLFFDPAVFQRGVAVTAMLVEQTQFAIAGAEQHEFLAQQLHHLWPGAEMIGDHDRPPIAAQHVTGRRARPDLGQQGVFTGFHGVSSRPAFQRACREGPPTGSIRQILRSTTIDTFWVSALALRRLAEQIGAASTDRPILPGAP